MTVSATEAPGTTDLPSYTGRDAHCPKCAHRGAKTSHIAEGETRTGDLAVRCRERRERLERYCPNCRYRWDEALAEPQRDGGDFLAGLVEPHRPRLERDPFSVGGIQYLASCPACDGNRKQLIVLGSDPIPECRYWAEAKARGLVQDKPSATQEV